MTFSSSELRKSLRHKRRQLPKSTRERFDLAINQRLLNSRLLLRSPHLACYLSNDGEPDLSLILNTVEQRNAACFLPVLSRHKKLKFARYHWGDDLKSNHYGILEPDGAQLFPARFLSLVLTPLVGFDLVGNRVGMGGGYYDRTFAFVPQSNAPVRPLLIGIAYEFQATDNLPHHPWDIPLDAIVTERRAHLCSPRAKQLFGQTDKT